MAEPVPNVTDRFSLADRVVVVTGASSGLGRRFAEVIVAAGGAVVLAARRLERLEALADELGDDALAVECDVTDPTALASLIDQGIERFGRIDGLVNNAGVSRVLPAIDDDIDGFRHEIEIDLVAPFELSRLVAKHLLETERPGSIVNIGSVLGLVGGGRLRAAGYAAAKGGIHNLTRELASQWARRGIRVNAIAPGWFETEMNAEMFDSDGGMAYITQNAPMGRAGVEGELDGALLFLLSDASSYVTGQVLAVDGGWTAI